MPSANVYKAKVKTDNTELPDGIVDTSLYGISKKLLLTIFKENGKPLHKGEILEIFADRAGKSTKDVYNTVTNGLSTLNEDRYIIGYKPVGMKFKGKLWGLKEWFNNGQIKPEYNPFPEGINEL